MGDEEADQVPIPLTEDSIHQLICEELRVALQHSADPLQDCGKLLLLLHSPHSSAILGTLQPWCLHDYVLGPLHILRPSHCTPAGAFAFHPL